MLNITTKRGLDGNMTNCLKINKRQNWVDHLLQQNNLTSTKQYNEKRLKKTESKLPKNIQLLKRVELQRAISEIITNPNDTWMNPKRERYMVPKPYFQNNWTLNKVKKVLLLVLMDFFLIWKKIHQVTNREMKPRTYALSITKFASTLCLKPT